MPPCWNPEIAEDEENKGGIDRRCIGRAEGDEALDQQMRGRRAGLFGGKCLECARERARQPLRRGSSSPQRSTIAVEARFGPGLHSMLLVEVRRRGFLLLGVAA